MTSLPTPFLLAASVLALGATPLNAQDQTGGLSWTLCTQGLELIETTIISADESAIIGIDQFGIRTTYAIDDLFFALPSSDRAHRPPDPELDPIQVPPIVEPETRFAPTRYLSLVDGQVIQGRLLDSNDPDTIQLVLYAGNSTIGNATLSLEQIRSMTDTPPMLADDFSTRFANADTIVTKNNDRLVGFIESIGSPEHSASISLDSAPDQAPISIALDQIKSITMANPPEFVPGMYLTTSDHLRLRVSSFDFNFREPMSIDVDTSSLGLDSTSSSPNEITWQLPPNAPAGITIQQTDARVIALASIAPSLIEPTGDRDWTPEPIVVASHTNPVLSTIDLRAPVRALYPVPKGASRFACELVAQINTWTDCVAHVLAIDRSGNRTGLLNQRLNADHPSQTLNTQLEPGTTHIEIRIEPGELGPIQDRVLLVKPRVLIES